MKKLKYSIQPTSEQSLYLYRTMCAYNTLYNIFATHPTLEQREKHASKYLCKFFAKYGDDVDKVAIERYYVDLLKKTDYDNPARKPLNLFMGMNCGTNEVDYAYL